LPKPYLLRRPSGLHVRFLVPVDLRAAIGSRFLVRRLPPSAVDLARLVAARMAVALSEAFERWRGSRMDDKDREDLLKVVSGSINQWTGNIQLPNGTKLTGLNVNGREDAQALLETIRGLALPGLLDVGLPNGPNRADFTLSDRIALYLADLRNAKTSPGNLLDSENTLIIFQEVAGPDLLMSKVGEAQVRAFLTGLHHWPSNARKKSDYKELTAPQIMAKVRQQRDKGIVVAGLSDRTLGKHRDRLASFFNAQVASGIIARSPLDGIKRQNSAQSVAALPRRQFTIEEINKIFDPENFLPWAKGRPDRYWAVLLAAGTGARVNEVGQLYAEDVAEVNGIWGIHIRAVHRDQKLKNANSLRFIPLHPRLLDAGILTYARDVMEAGHERLFPHLPWHKKAGYGDALGDQFRAYLVGLGMMQPGMGFHSFRHTASTRLLYAGVLSSIAAAITGHKAHMPGELGTYVDVPTLQSRADAVALLPVPEGLPVYQPGEATQSLRQAQLRAKRRAVNAAARERKAVALAKSAQAKTPASRVRKPPQAS